LLNSLTDLIKGARTEELPERISDLLNKMKDIEKELATVRSAQALAQVGDLAKTAKVINGISYISSVMADGVSGDDLRKIALDLRSLESKSVVALISANEGKPVLVVATSEQARSGGVKAGALVKIGSTVLGGGGGGKDDFAQGGGTDASKSLEALTAISNALIG
jgi:alanyl-tRNA synthetase